MRTQLPLPPPSYLSWKVLAQGAKTLPAAVAALPGGRGHGSGGTTEPLPSSLEEITCPPRMPNCFSLGLYEHTKGADWAWAKGY